MQTNGTGKKIAYGPEVNLQNCPNVYAPQDVKEFTPPPTGIDNLGITSTDTFSVPGIGEATVDFKGWVRVARSKPTEDTWESAEVYTNLIEMYMRGESESFGPIIVTLQPEILSTGMIRNPRVCEGHETSAKACRMAVAAQFDLPKLGLQLFNREPIELTIDNVKSIPPAGSPGKGQIYFVLPLFSRTDPDGKPAAYLTSLKFQMGTYLTPGQMQSAQQ
jgi:hypothetical protein